MKKITAIFAAVTLMLSMLLPMSVSAKTTVEMAHVAGETTTLRVVDLFSRWKSDNYGMDSNVKRNGVEYVAYTGNQNESTGGSVEENYVTVTFPENGTYTFTFVAHKKAQATVNLMLDDTVIGTQAKDDEVGAGVNIADQFGDSVTAAWFGPTGYASPREYTVTAEVTAGAHRVGYDVTPASDGRIILFIGNIDITGPSEPEPEPEPDYPDISATEETRIEAESIIETTYGTGESTWANLQNKMMFYGGGGVSANFYAGTNGDNYLWGEPDATHFKLRTTREFVESRWYDVSYVVSSQKSSGSVSPVVVSLQPIGGGEAIVIGSNEYPEGGKGDGKYIEDVTITDSSANFMNTYCGVFRYNTAVYVPAGDYVVEFTPLITADNKYKFYADYIAFTPGTEPVPDYPDISLTGETRIEAEDILVTKIGTGLSDWGTNTSLQNKVMFYAGSEVSDNFYIGSSAAYDTHLWGEPDETHFKAYTNREFLESGWYDFEYMMSGAKSEHVSAVSIVLTPLDGGDAIIAGTNPHPDNGAVDNIDITPVTITNSSATFMNTWMGSFRYNTTVWVPAGNYRIEILPDAAEEDG
ncbi:MAG: hypothetical protein IJC78_00675, partial [Clostridia bacterium]|nr:hypothetical protein [Clostridia bacterium]